MTNIVGIDSLALASVVRSAATGDEVAFARLVDTHHPSMARVAYVIAGDVDSANDAVQAAWAIAWQRLGSLRDPERVGAWLTAIAANEARKGLARRRRARIVDISSQVAAEMEADPIAAVEALDLARAMRGLSPDERTVLALRYVAGFDATEIGRHLGMSASGVRSRLARTLHRLRLDLDVGEHDR